VPVRVAGVLRHAESLALAVAAAGGWGADGDDALADGDACAAVAYGTRDGGDRACVPGAV